MHFIEMLQVVVGSLLHMGCCVWDYDVPVEFVYNGRRRLIVVGVPEEFFCRLIASEVFFACGGCCYWLWDRYGYSYLCVGL